MVAQMTIHISYPLPANVPPQMILDALHQSYEPLIRPHPYLKQYKQRRMSVSEVIDDPFFLADGRKLEAYEVIERVPIIPGLHKDITIPAVFQSFDRGVRCRADAQGGVRVWSTYEIRPVRHEQQEEQQQQQPGAGFGGVTAPKSEGWELFETARVQCSSLVKPFVARSFETAHREILKGTVDEIVKMNTPGFSTQQAFGPQPGFSPPQQRYKPQQSYNPQQGYNPQQQDYNSQQGYNPQQGYTPQPGFEYQQQQQGRRSQQGFI